MPDSTRRPLREVRISRLWKQPSLLLLLLGHGNSLSLTHPSITLLLLLILCLPMCLLSLGTIVHKHDNGSRQPQDD
jgi:hypothetical protein